MAISRSQMERQLRNMGGIMSLQEPRQGYFIGKLVKKAKRAVKKVVKSPIGKAAILGGLTFGVPGTGFKGLLGAGKGGGLGSIIKRSLLGRGAATDFGTGSKGLLRTLGLTKGGFGSFGGLTNLGKIAGIGGLAGLAGLAAAGEQDENEIDFSKLDRGEGLNILDIVARARKNDPEFRFLPGAEFTDMYAEGGRIGFESGDYVGSRKNETLEDEYNSYVKEIELGLNEYADKPMSFSSFKKMIAQDYKKGGRIGKQEGGIMDLGGMEMDLRGGGFVPLGAKEKADDVPARLSKNEFVMTADAVRAAGGGSVDKGADKMYNLMKDLEAKV